MRILPIFVAVMALFITACGADTHESVVDEQLTLMEEMADILESVNDEASAKEAEAKMAALATDAEELEARMKKLDPPTQEEDKALETKHGARMKKVMERIMSLSMKAMQFPALRDAMTRANEAMKNK